MRRLVPIAFMILLGSCGGGSSDNLECAVAAERHYSCFEDKVYLCPTGNAQDAAANAAIDDACKASAGDNTDTFAKCMLNAGSSGKYKMAPMVLSEDCTASGMICDVFTDACAAKK
jgi:hypothetical protein